jgi:hypothetical protein
MLWLQINDDEKGTGTRYGTVTYNNNVYEMVVPTIIDDLMYYLKVRVVENGDIVVFFIVFVNNPRNFQCFNVFLKFQTVVSCKKKFFAIFLNLSLLVQYR